MGSRDALGRRTPRADGLRDRTTVKRFGEFLFAMVSSFAASMARRGTRGTGGKDEKMMSGSRGWRVGAAHESGRGPSDSRGDASARRGGRDGDGAARCD